ncbi:SDR family oxidoreductase [Streptomyces caniferus]|uniref:hypothetical protein n=1 Tax=Streptomyces caniferus TaxID=285557 RepID=UPI002E2B494A|nr:hypothetical protein [Streptomyces caniferus]
MSRRPTGKVVMVTGAARGRTAAEAEALEQEGATVIATDTSRAALTAHHPSAYTTSTWALHGLTRTTALELGPRGNQVQGHAPSPHRLRRTGEPHRPPGGSPHPPPAPAT